MLRKRHGDAESVESAVLDLLIVVPSNGRNVTGNGRSADQWSQWLAHAGHDVRILSTYDGEGADAMIALHASLNHAAVKSFRAAHPEAPIIVALTGTDIYPDPDKRALGSMELADRIIALQPAARDKVPAALQNKLRVIVQSAEAPASNRSLDTFDVCVVGGLRPVKDPMRAAAASRLLPEASRIRILHAGPPLDPRYIEEIEIEQRDNPRYRWLGALDPATARQLIADSRLLVVSSRNEGGARVIGEAVVAGTPILAARNDASRALLGEDFAGLFEFGDTQGLADLMRRAETDAAFWEQLREQAGSVAAQFGPARERDTWAALIEELR